MKQSTTTINTQRNNINHGQTNEANGVGSNAGRAVSTQPAGDGRGESGVTYGSGNTTRGAGTLNTDGGLEPPQAGPGTRERNSNPTIRTRARLDLATLNIRGTGLCTTDNDAPEKWLKLNQLIRDNRIAILAVQETHLTEQRTEQLNRLFEVNLKVFNTSDPVNPTGARGAAIVLNRKVVNTDEAVATEIIPGRALMVSIPWKRGDRLRILNVYAPNAATENESFWRNVAEELDRKHVRPDIMLGDLNMVEQKEDRLPAHADAAEAVHALKELLNKYRLEDTWRKQNMTTRAYTYLQNATGSQSRIDRVYMNQRLEKCVQNWTISGPGIATDHQLVVCQMANLNKPYTGKGRWRLHSSLLEDREFLDMVKQRGILMENEIKSIRERTTERNPQLEYASFKSDIRAMAKARASAKIPKIDRRIQRLRKDLEKLLKRTESGDVPEETIKENAAILQERISALELKRFGNKRMAVAARYWLEGETISKYWIRMNTTPLHIVIEPIYELKKEGGSPSFATRSDEMAEIAMRHYNKVQEDLEEPNETEHNQRIKETLVNTHMKLLQRQKADLAKPTDKKEIEEAIREAANGKAPGLDGLPSELWKALLEMHQTDIKKERRAFDILGVMQEVFRDIARHGVVVGTDFTKGWICPIYKKKDKREIVNYRPITLLNADYKIFTKTLAMRLANVAPSIIHPNQAGFVPGRKIHNQAKLTKLIIDYCEVEEVEGMIVALDQEKAYDKINHNYLWRVLEHMNFPNNFIKTIKNLYEAAESVVIINGIVSTAFKIIRGVRQGDPVSCLLFDFAIEPLACNLRASGLRGIEIPGVAERLITTLFADDTTVYLHATDSYDELLKILEDWCGASRAKFNEEKTELIPLGNKEYRERLARTRRMNERDQPLAGTARIVPDGVAIRTLGSWIGNNIDNHTPWNRVIGVLESQMTKWDKRKPTLTGRRLIAGLEFGGRTQYLTRVQTMPEDVAKTLIKMMREFIWKGDKHPRVAMEQLYKPAEQGGLALLDLQARNEAIDLMWLKDYLDLTESRPTWAYVADVLYAKAKAASAKTVEETAQINPFLQTWKVSMRRTAKLPEDLRQMMRTAQKYQTRIEATNPAERLKSLMPAWYHTGQLPGRSIMNSLSHKCLRETHGVSTVADAEAVAKRTTRVGRGNNHKETQTCQCYDCERDRTRIGCPHPARCAKAAAALVNKLNLLWKPSERVPTDGLSLTKTGVKRNIERWNEEDVITFNPSIMEEDNLGELFRVFTTREMRTHPTRRPPRPFELPNESYRYTIAPGVSKEGEGLLVAIHEKAEEERIRIIHVEERTRQECENTELLAALHIATITPPFAPLTIATASRTLIEGLSTNLRTWENKGWLDIAYRREYMILTAKLRKRSAVTNMEWISEPKKNREITNMLQKVMSEETETEELHNDAMDAAMEYLRDGVKLSTITQKIAYKGVRKLKTKEDRKTTTKMIERIQTDLKQTTGESYKAESIWKSLKRPEISKTAKDLIWKSIHDAYKVGAYWKNIPGYEEREKCAICDETETMEHIMINCKDTAAVAIRIALRETLEKRIGVNAPPLQLGTALGAMALIIPGGTTTERLAKERFYRIAVTEAMALIWRLRCERVIAKADKPEEWTNATKARNVWMARMENRRALDFAVCWRKGKRNLKERKVAKDTWRELFKKKKSRADLETDGLGVLVGSSPPPTPRGERRG